jgi:hypothetical protein
MFRPNGEEYFIPRGVPPSGEVLCWDQNDPFVQRPPGRSGSAVLRHNSQLLHGRRLSHKPGWGRVDCRPSSIAKSYDKPTYQY